MQGRAKTHPRPSWLVSRLSWLVPSSWALAISRSCDRGVTVTPRVTPLVSQGSSTYKCLSRSCPLDTLACWWNCLLVGCLTSQQQASVSQGRICSDNLTCCHTEIEVANPTFHLTQSQYTDTGPTSPSADPLTPGAWQGSHWSANV